MKPIFFLQLEHLLSGETTNNWGKNAKTLRLQMFQQIFSMICTPRSITAARSKVTECCLANNSLLAFLIHRFSNKHAVSSFKSNKSKVLQNLESSSCWRQWQKPRVWRHCQTHRLVLTQIRQRSMNRVSSESCELMCRLRTRTGL